MKSFAELVVIFGLVGGGLVSFVCFVQVDMKSLVAYSSVVHMGLLLGGIRTRFNRGITGALAIMVGHGVISSGLFYMVGCMFDRRGRRRILVGKGYIIIYPGLAVFWFILRIFNIRAPPSVNLLGEILLSVSLLKWDWITFILLILINFIRMGYGFYLYAFRQHGKVRRVILSSGRVILRELLVGLVHVATVMLIVLRF